MNLSRFLKAGWVVTTLHTLIGEVPAMPRGGVCILTGRKQRSPEHQEKATTMMIIIIINEQTANKLQVSTRIVDGCELIN